jgi:hypothetical protein
VKIRPSEEKIKPEPEPAGLSLPWTVLKTSIFTTAFFTLATASIIICEKESILLKTFVQDSQKPNHGPETAMLTAFGNNKLAELSYLR